MAGWVFCNRCFRPPQRTSCFSLTNCGHVYCDVCLGEGGKDECLICKVPCRTVFLSKHTDADIQALFMGIDSLCKKYSRETSQISEFQEKHRKRLLAFYQEKITELEESLRKSALRMEELQGTRLLQGTAFSTIKTPVSNSGRHPLLPRDASASDRAESMQVGGTPSPVRKPEVAVGPARISLISPPQHGRMGSISRRGPQPPGPPPGHGSASQALRVCRPRGGHAQKVNEVLPRPSARRSRASGSTRRRGSSQSGWEQLTQLNKGFF